MGVATAGAEPATRGPRSRLDQFLALLTQALTIGSLMKSLAEIPHSRNARLACAVTLVLPGGVTVVGMIGRRRQGWEEAQTAPLLALPHRQEDSHLLSG